MDLSHYRLCGGGGGGGDYNDNNDHDNDTLTQMVDLVEVTSNQ